MKTRASIKSSAFISKFQTRMDLNKSGIKCFVSAIRKNVFPGARNDHLEERQKSSLADPAVRCSRGQRRIKKLESSIKCGFESISSTYNNFLGPVRKPNRTKHNNISKGFSVLNVGNEILNVWLKKFQDVNMNLCNILLPTHLGIQRV
jgi:hypothetical protein